MRRQGCCTARRLLRYGLVSAVFALAWHAAVRPGAGGDAGASREPAAVREMRKSKRGGALRGDRGGEERGPVVDEQDLARWVGEMREAEEAASLAHRAALAGEAR